MIMAYNSSVSVGAETARRMRRRRQLTGFGSWVAPHLMPRYGYVSEVPGGWPEFIGGAVAAEDDVTVDKKSGKVHSPMHAITIGVMTGISVHIAVQLIDRWLGFKR